MQRRALSALQALSLTFFAACQSSAPTHQPGTVAPASNTVPHDLLFATLYVNRAAEYDATCRTVYAAATARLDQLARATGRRGAVVLDVDETVLDNSPYEVRLVQDGGTYPTGWDDWCNEARAEPVPGVVEFIAAARKRNVEVFYVTNRKAHLEDGTRRNLERHGLLEERDFDTVYMQGEEASWTKDKTSRREAVRANFDILLLIGDNVGDFYAFDEARPTNDERTTSVESRDAAWGDRWFMLPNPMYGGWDEAAVRYDYRADDVRARRLSELDAAR